MSYSYHIHIDQQSINKWKYQEILDLSMNRIIDNVKDCLFKCNLQHLTNLHLFILQEGVRYTQEAPVPAFMKFEMALCQVKTHCSR